MTDAVRSWNHKGYEGKPVRVEVYTGCGGDCAVYKMAAALNEKQLARPRKNIACFETVYQPGVIEAAAYRDGVEVGRDCIKTASDNLMLEVIPDRKVIPAGASDICYIDLSLKDEAGNLNPEAVTEVMVTVAGAGSLLGFEALIRVRRRITLILRRKPMRGRLRAAIRAERSDEILVTFSSVGMRAQTVTILAE